MNKQIDLKTKEIAHFEKLLGAMGGPKRIEIMQEEINELNNTKTQL